MKFANQILTFLLIGVLLSSTIGISINEHYCQDHLITTTIGMDLFTSCSCEMPMQDDCCQDVSTFYVLTGLFNIVVNNVSDQPNYRYVESAKFNFDQLAIANQPYKFHVFKDVFNPMSESKIYIQVQSFLL